MEQWRPAKQENAQTEISKADKELALSFLKSADIFAELLADFNTLGVTGEEINKLVGYLAATSRKLAASAVRPDPVPFRRRQVHPAGCHPVAYPGEEYIKYTRVTDQALFYKEEDSLVNKILAIEEAEGMGGAAYSIRNIQSAGKITVAATGKNPGTGKMQTRRVLGKRPGLA